MCEPDYQSWCWCNIETYGAGENFPEVVSDTDVYVYGDYVYLYNVDGSPGAPSNLKIDGVCDVLNAVGNKDMNGWKVAVNRLKNNASKTVFGEILTYINNKSVVSMDGTFYQEYSKPYIFETAPAIPSTINTMYMAFSGNTNLKTVSFIPDNVINMNRTFEGCTSLENVYNLPKNGKQFHTTFSRCSSLVVAPTLPQSATGMNAMFSGCSSLTTYHGNNTGDFTGFVIPANIKDCLYSFSGCTSLTTMPKLPDGIQDISYMFEGCINLITASEIPVSVLSMNELFTNCANLTGTIEINTNTENYERIFEGTNKEIILIGSSINLESIASTGHGNIIYHCNIPDGTTHIYDFSLRGNIYAFTIPDSVTFIGECAFYGTHVPTFYYKGTIAQWNAINKHTNWHVNKGDTTVVCSDGEVFYPAKPLEY